MSVSDWRTFPVLRSDYGRFVPMHFRSRERNDHTVNVRFRERKCGRFVPGNETSIQLTFVPGNERVDVNSLPGTKLPSNSYITANQMPKKRTTCNKLEMIFADRKL